MFIVVGGANAEPGGAASPAKAAMRASLLQLDRLAVELGLVPRAGGEG